MVYESNFQKTKKSLKPKFRKWFAQRGAVFVRKRSLALLSRYGLSSSRAKNRIKKTISMLAQYGCSPTLLVPGIIVKRYSKFICHLQDVGVELGVHSYDHIDLKVVPPEVAGQQLLRAAQTFAQYGIQPHGFRCPYLSYTDELLNELPQGIFRYSSNIAIMWNDVLKNKKDPSKVFETIDKFYQPKRAEDFVCTPWTNSKVIEIPVCVPDDLQLKDGLGLDSESIGDVWCRILDKSLKRGELFTLLFHTELSDYCDKGFSTLLNKARSLQPKVWISRLSDISDWWWEKSKFKSVISPISTGLRISFACSSRATILAKGIAKRPEIKEWDGTYFQIITQTLDVPLKPRPFVGIAPGISKEIVFFLKDQGYILDTNKTASQCSVYLTRSVVAQLKTQVELVDWIENSAGPLVKFWRWPDGAKCALSVTGDLDALSLTDYALRLIGR